jgi:hypothetical protein
VDGYLLCKSSRASPNAIQTDRYVLGSFLGGLGDDVTVDAAVRAYLAHEQARGLAPSTVVRPVNPPRIPTLRPRALTAPVCCSCSTWGRAPRGGRASTRTSPADSWRL